MVQSYFRCNEPLNFILDTQFNTYFLVYFFRQQKVTKHTKTCPANGKAILEKPFLWKLTKTR